MKWIKAAFFGVCFLVNHSFADSSGNNTSRDVTNTCDGHWINPITDVCWKCLFPMSIGQTKVSSGSLPDTVNPSSPVQLCPAPPPIFKRIGIAIGFWEPIAVTDVTRNPMCMVNLGGMKIGGLKKNKIGASAKGSDNDNSNFYHAHWYNYPLINWLKIFTDMACLQGGDFDIGYLTELDPMWQNDMLSAFVNPEAMLFGNPIAQSSCITDAIASEVGTPINTLFWCAGGHGSIYPFTGSIGEEVSGLNSSVLITERMNFKLHRQGIVTDSVPYNTAVCSTTHNPILPKDRYRYQLVNPIADANNCHPYGRGVMRWQIGKEMPTTHKNYGHLIWRKRNCVVF